MSDSEAKQHVSSSGGTDSGAVQSGDINVAVGDVLGGKFRVARILGAGGMGVVVEARDIDLDERVAIKLLLPAALERSDVVARFRREARAAVKIKSEHIARVLDVGSLDDGAPFIVMEYLEGYDLSKPIRNGGKLPISVVIDYVLQASEAIAEAHAIGVVHRDIKPPNLFLTQRADGSPCIKVLDFGISKIVGALDAAGEGETPEVTLTHTSVVLGSPRYMAPEQISKPKSVDARADIWGIGTTFYRMVTGTAPYEGNSLPEIFAAILMTPDGPPPIEERCPDAPAGLDAVIRKCMRINPDERWQNLGQFANALAPFGTDAAKRSAERVCGILQSAGHSTSPPPNVAIQSPASTSGAALSNTLDIAKTSESPPKPRNAALIAMSIAALLFVVVAGVLFAMRDEPRDVALPVRAPTETVAVTAPSAMPTPEQSAPTVESAAAPDIASAAPTVTTSVKPAAVKKAPAPTKTNTESGDGEELFDQRN